MANKVAIGIVLLNRCSWKFHKIHRKAPFIKKETLAHVFSSRFCEISKNNFCTLPPSPPTPNPSSNKTHTHIFTRMHITSHIPSSITHIFLQEILSCLFDLTGVFVLKHVVVCFLLYRQTYINVYMIMNNKF